MIRVDPADPMAALGQGPIIAYRDQPVRELIEAQVGVHGDHLAVECVDSALSYRDQWKRAASIRDLLAGSTIPPRPPCG